jgi:hypothetical protein
MQTFNRICVKDYTITDREGTSFSIERGKEYLTSTIHEAPLIGPEPFKDHVIVFSSYWVPVPIEHFAGEIEFTKA